MLAIGMFTSDSADYVIVGDGLALFDEINLPCINLKIPAEVLGEDGKFYKIIGFSEKYQRNWATTISFDEFTEIDAVPMPIIHSCRQKIVLPPKIKRIRCDKNTNYGSNFNRVIILDKGNRYVSVIGKKGLINNFPHEIINYSSKKRNVTIRETTKIIGNRSFFYNNFLIFVVISSSVEEIGDHAFSICKNLRSVKFLKNSKLRKIGEGAFTSTSLRSIEIPESLEEIGQDVFCFIILDSFPIPANSKLRMIGKECFADTELKSICFHKSLESVGEDAFMGCEELEYVSFHEESKIKVIDEGTFESCPLLKTVIFSSSIEVIEEKAFYTSGKCLNVSFPADSKLNAIKTKAFSESHIQSIELPSSLESIGEGAFSMCKDLTRVSFAMISRLKLIEYNAFEGSSIESIVLPSSLETIGESAFSGCKNLTHVSFQPNSMLKKIESKAFSFTNIRKIVLPFSVTCIGSEAFMGCQQLVSASIINILIKKKVRDISDTALLDCPCKCFT